MKQDKFSRDKTTTVRIRIKLRDAVKEWARNDKRTILEVVDMALTRTISRPVRITRKAQEIL